MDELVPLARPRITEAEIAEVAQVLRSGWLTTGPRVRAFEERCRAFLGCAHALALASGTAALHLALHALGLGPGDEVVTTPLTFPATLNAILMVGATPVLADVDAETLQLSPAAASARLGPRTRAILVVHYGGAPADLEALERLRAARPGLALVEDAAQAMGARLGGRPVGARSQAACFSFHPAKNMTTAEGGLLVTSDPELDRRARLSSWHGIDRTALDRREAPASWYYEVQDLGWKYNFTDLQAALGLGQLAALEGANAERRAVAAAYDAAFASLPGVRVAPTRPEAESARQIYWMVLDPERYDRDRFLAALLARRIAAGVHYIPLHLHPYYRRRFGWAPGLCPVAERAYQGLCSIPLYHGMPEAAWRRVVEAVPAALAEARR